MSSDRWIRGPIGAGSAARVTRAGCHTALVVVPTLAAGTRLFDLVPLFCQWPVCSPRRRPDVLPTDGQIDLPNGGQIIPRLGGTPLTATVSPPAPRSPARDGSCHLG